MSTITRPVAGELEQRAAPDVRLDGRRLRGVIPYGVESRDLGGWREVMDRGCLGQARMGDLVCRPVDHDGLPLGRYPTTLALEDRDDGLHWSVELPESRADIREAVQRGDVRSSSWRMVVADERWDGDVRHVARVEELRDVSLAINPAYPAAAAEYRSLQEENMPETATVEPETEERTQPEPPETPPEPPPSARGTLRLEDRSARHERPIETRIVEAIRSIPRGEARALTTAEGSAGPVIPDQLNAYIWQHIESNTVFLQSGVPSISTDRNSLTMPMFKDGLEIAWVSELEQIPKGDPDLGELTATPKKLAHIVEASSEALDDSSPDLMAFIQAALLRAVARKFDRDCFIGNDPKGITGIANVAGISTLVAPELDSFDVLLRAGTAISAQGFSAAPVAVLHPFTELAFNLLKNADSDPFNRPAGLPRILVSDQLPIAGGKADALVYSPSAMLVVRRRDATIDVDRSGDYFQNDSAGVRVRARADVAVGRPSGIVKITGLPAGDPLAPPPETAGARSKKATAV